MNASQLIERLQLLPHPEGGYYKETYRSALKIAAHGGAERNVSTTIYYLLENDNKSHFHRIKSDEFWFFHQGNPIEILVIDNGHINSIILGNDIEKGELPQAMVPAGMWFAAHIQSESGFALTSCTVAPGFDFADFELADRNVLLNECPGSKDVVGRFIR